MRNVFIACAVVLFAGTCMLDACAGWFGGGKKAEEKAAVQAPDQAATGALSKEEKKQQEQLKAQQKAAEEALKLRLAQQQKIIAQLNNQEWQLELTPLTAAAKAKKEFDVVTFKDNKVSIAGFVKKGFQPTNYSLTVQEDGMVIWETMQTSEKAGTAFWRGEMPKDMLSIRGVVSHVVDAKTKTDYSFVSTSKRALSSETK